ncbi:MAG TPA: nuclear transport factor 2 family protein [Longimicrobiales bacterium]|nr:nuclear transport factor 2 family protein [Longimicrobiales bacterium]
MRRYILASFVLVHAAVLGTPVRGEAQIRPGIERGDYWGEVRAKYRSETLQEVGPLMDAWLSDWSRGRGDAEAVDAMLEEFSENGVLILDGVTFSNVDDIRAALARRPAGGAEQSLSDFDVRGDMAFALARIRHTGVTTGQPVTGSLGLVVWVFVKEGSDWRIRSLVFDEGS